MESNPTWLAVVALALQDESGRLLMQQRPDHKHHGGLWEFPGGKVEKGENPRQALVREIAEELGVRIEADDLIPAFVADEAGSRMVVLILYTCLRWCGDVEPAEGQDWGWFSQDQASALPMPPMDASLLRRIAD
ncbi:(deoxy)nucleoside triphosphate pyrophosphohydrolase [Alteraurantiacibacter aestuarii]|uniref:(deoxy)nucleoside triphosphate pyrophosphohydrolase n=1 Tax=Alteraurantiacibacter aestuarii TaxID=650004 RepID=UPI0031D48068